MTREGSRQTLAGNEITSTLGRALPQMSAPGSGTQSCGRGAQAARVSADGKTEQRQPWGLQAPALRLMPPATAWTSHILGPSGCA